MARKGKFPAGHSNAEQRPPLATSASTASSSTNPNTQPPPIKKKKHLEEVEITDQIKNMIGNSPIGIPFQQFVEERSTSNLSPAAVVPDQQAPPAWTPPVLPDVNPPVPRRSLKLLRVFLMGGLPFLAYNKITYKVMGECIFRAIIHVLASHGNVYMTKDAFMHQYRTCFGCPELNGYPLFYDQGLLNAKIIKKYLENITVKKTNWYRLKPAFLLKYTTLPPADPNRVFSAENLDELPPSLPLDPTVIKQMVRDASHDFINMAMRFVAFCPSDFDAGLPFQDMRRYLPVFYMELHPQPGLPAGLPLDFERVDEKTFNGYLVSAAVDTGMTQRAARKKLERFSQVVLTALETERQTELEAYWGPMAPAVPTTTPSLIPPPPASPPPQDAVPPPPPPPPPSSQDHAMIPRPMSPVTISDDEGDAMDLEEPSPLTSSGNGIHRHDVQSVSSGSEPSSPRSEETEVPTANGVVGRRASRSAPTGRARKVIQERFAPYQAATSRNLAVRDRASALEPRIDALGGLLPVPLLPSLETLSMKPLRPRRAVILSGPRLPRTEDGNPVPALTPGLPQSRTEILKRRREALDKIVEYAWRLPMKIAAPAERLS
ncbi:hypothetical protein EC968_001786 [Mortierella alpina]|nr:hypothetical protein EC968_001786 [Mortierella alpina]